MHTVVLCYKIQLTCQVLQELSCIGAVDVSMVARDGDGHGLLHSEVAVLQLHYFGSGRRDG